MIRGLLLAGVLALLGGVAVLVAGPATVAGAGHVAVAAPDVGRLPSGGAVTAGGRGDAVPRGARVRMPRLGVDAPVVHVAVRDLGGRRVMTVPRDPHTVGWWSGSARPGSGRGTVVLVGHVDYDGVAGALGVLPRARPGDRVTVGSSAGVRRYRIVAVRSYPKTIGIPTAAFRADGPPQLVLVTCGGPFDPVDGNYEDNVVAYAVPMR